MSNDYDSPFEADLAAWAEEKGIGRPAPNDDCWTVGIGAILHKLGDMPEACLTCAAKVAEDRTRTPRDPSPGVG